MFQRLASIASPTPRSSAHWSKARAFAAVIVLAGLGLGGCAQQPQQLAAAGHSKEYFPSSVYGRASRRVIEDGQPIPRGGGQYLVGKPYTVAGQTYYPSERRITQVGLASWYGDAFHGRLTANGEIYDRDSFTAAHPTMPLPSYARVTNLRNNTSMIVRVNDRGPYHSARVMDVSRRVADALDIRRAGTAKVKVEWVGRASLAGSDDAKLAATLRTDGPARMEGVEENVMVAAAPAPARVASLGSYYPAARRPAPIDEEARSERLQAPAPRRVHQIETPQQDEVEVAPRRDRPRAVSGPASRRLVDEEEASTGSIARSHREIARPPTRSRGEAARLAHEESASGNHDDRARHADRSAPGLRRASLAQERAAPQPRLSRIASVLPPARPHAIGLRMIRSRDD